MSSFNVSYSRAFAFAFSSQLVTDLSVLKDSVEPLFQADGVKFDPLRQVSVTFDSKNPQDSSIVNEEKLEGFILSYGEPSTKGAWECRVKRESFFFKEYSFAPWNDVLARATDLATKIVSSLDVNISRAGLQSVVEIYTDSLLAAEDVFVESTPYLPKSLFEEKGGWSINQQSAFKNKEGGQALLGSWLPEEDKTHFNVSYIVELGANDTLISDFIGLEMEAHYASLNAYREKAFQRLFNEDIRSELGG